MSETHQGYTNYETFSVGVTLENDTKMYERWIGEAHARLAYAHEQEPTGTPEIIRDCAVAALALDLREWGDEVAEPFLDSAPDAFSSAFRAGYQAIDWHDIASQWVDLALEMGE